MSGEDDTEASSVSSARMHTRLPPESSGWRLKPIKETAVTPAPPQQQLTNSQPKWGKVQPSLSKTDKAPDEWLYQQFGGC